MLRQHRNGQKDNGSLTEHSLRGVYSPFSSSLYFSLLPSIFPPFCLETYCFEHVVGLVGGDNVHLDALAVHKKHLELNLLLGTLLHLQRLARKPQMMKSKRKKKKKKNETTVKKESKQKRKKNEKNEKTETEMSNKWEKKAKKKSREKTKKRARKARKRKKGRRKQRKKETKKRKKKKKKKKETNEQTNKQTKAQPRSSFVFFFCSSCF